MSTPLLQYYLSERAIEAGIRFTPPRPSDAGFDLPCSQAISLEPGGFALIPTGLHLSIPEGWVGLLRDRSSVALSGGVVVAGVIDASYRGEVRVVMYNFGKEPLCFELGARVAQCVVVPHLTGE